MSRSKRNAALQVRTDYSLSLHVNGNWDVYRVNFCRLNFFFTFLVRLDGRIGRLKRLWAEFK